MLFSKKDLRRIIIPLMIEQAFAVTIGMVDAVMVASVGEEAGSGVSLVDTINLLLVYLFSNIAGGGAVVISQLLGQEDYKAAKEASKQLIWLVFLISSFVTMMGVIFRIPLLNLVFGKVAPGVMANARSYFLFTLLSFPFLGLYSAGASIFRAMGNSKISMRTSLLMNVINVVGNAILIYIAHWGAAGAAIATLFSRIVGAVLMLRLVVNKENKIYVEKLFHFKPKLAYIKRICGIGIPNGMESGMFQFGKVITQSLISSFGTVQISANAICNSLTALQYIPGNAIGLSIIIIVGRCIGAGEKEQAKKYSRMLLKLTYASIFIISLILCVFSKQFVGMFHYSKEASDIAVKLILLHSAFVCTIWPFAFTVGSVFRSASDVKFPMVISVSSMWVFRVGLSFVFGKFLRMGVSGIWWAMFSDWFFRMIIYTTRYFKGTWLTKYKKFSDEESS